MQGLPIIKFMYSNLYSDTKNGSMETAHEIMTRLKFIGKLKKGEKVNVKTLTVEKINWITRAWRTVKGFTNQSEGRESTLTFLTTTYNRVFDIIQLSSGDKHGDKHLCINLIRDIGNSFDGLRNLKSTYSDDSDDRLFSCHMDTLVELIQSKLKKIQEEHPELFYTSEETEIQSHKIDIPKSPDIVEQNIDFN